MMNPYEHINYARTFSQRSRLWAVAPFPFMVFVIINAKWAIFRFYDQTGTYWPSGVPVNLQLPSVIASLIAAVYLWIHLRSLDRKFLVIARNEFEIAYPNADERTEVLKRLKDEVVETGIDDDGWAEQIALTKWKRARLRSNYGAARL